MKRPPGKGEPRKALFCVIFAMGQIRKPGKYGWRKREERWCCDEVCWRLDAQVLSRPAKAGSEEGPDPHEDTILPNDIGIVNC